MKSAHHIRNLWTAFGGVLLLTILAVAADRWHLLSGVRVGLHDALSPGRMVVAAISSRSVPAAGAANSESQAGMLERQRQHLEQQRRELIIENARLHNQLRQLGASKGYSNRDSTLVGFDLISASVLSRHGMPVSLHQVMIDAGRVHGLTRSELVLDTRGLLLDQGVQDRVADGSVVLAGSVVLGRVSRAGRWVSQLVPVTDESYSARIRLVRRTPRGTQLGAEGILEGTGEACRLSGIPDTASVSVGDEVFAADINGISGPRLYYGSVNAAKFESAAGWSIAVKPAVGLADVDSVAVVVPRLDLERVASAEQASGAR